VLGYRSNVVLLEDGTVWGWGANTNGQISYPKVYEAP
jgi:alpha-tubulin suppressor-like RCC1 family protein